MSSTINALTSGGGLAMAGDTSGQLALQSAGTTFATGNQYGIGLGTAVPSSGIGIAFPATQSASTDANTLDDYEEGSWTVLVTCGTSGTVTTGNKTGRYVKVGSLVSVTMYIDFSAVSSPVGYLRFTLPFTAGSGTLYESAISCTFNNVSSVNINNFLGIVNNGTANLDVYLGNATSLTATSANQMTTSTGIRISAHYMV
jgi:hypothetical protein